MGGEKPMRKSSQPLPTSEILVGVKRSKVELDMGHYGFASIEQLCKQYKLEGRVESWHT